MGWDGIGWRVPVDSETDYRVFEWGVLGIGVLSMGVGDSGC